MAVVVLISAQQGLQNQSFPFVLGNWLAMRGSCRRAASTARAFAECFMFVLV
jgi:hypothetical protein